MARRVILRQEANKPKVVKTEKVEDKPVEVLPEPVVEELEVLPAEAVVPVETVEEETESSRPAPRKSRKSGRAKSKTQE